MRREDLLDLIMRQHARTAACRRDNHLREAKMDRALLKGADFTRRLQRANLIGALLAHARLDDADLSGARNLEHLKVRLGITSGAQVAALTSSANCVFPDRQERITPRRFLSGHLSDSRDLIGGRQGERTTGALPRAAGQARHAAGGNDTWLLAQSSGRVSLRRSASKNTALSATWFVLCALSGFVYYLAMVIL
jgi:Pentapeptide repeats (8 copies)